MFDRFFPAAGQYKDIYPTWRYFYLALFLGFVLRLMMSVWGDGPVHPDEVFQYYEQAHRLVYGYGLIPWEYAYGIRSWAIPLGVGSILELGRIVGWDHPSQYMPLVETVFSLISLLLPIAMYRFSQTFLPERQAITVFVLGCFWHTLLYLAHKPMPGILACYSLMWMFVLFCRVPTSRRLFLIGVLSCLTLVLRYQLLPVVGLANLLALVLLGRAYVYVLAGNLVVLLGAGVVDYLFWGAFLSSYIDNFKINFFYDIASRFGTDGPLYYLRRLYSETWGLIIPALFGLLLVPRQMLPVVGMVFMGALAFIVPAHKEFRFIVWTYPFILIGLVVFTARVVPLLRLPTILGSVALVAMLAASGLVSGVHIARYTALVPVRDSRQMDMAAVYVALAADPAVTGVELRAHSVPWRRARGYYALHHPVPVYFQGWHLDKVPSDAPALAPHVSHVVTDAAPGPNGFDAAGQFGRLYLWRAVQPTTRGGWDDYQFNTPLPAPDILEQITPRGAVRP